MRSIKEIKREHGGEWLAVALPEDASTDAGELLFHSKNESEVWQQIHGDPRRIFVVYAGPPLPLGWAAAF